MNTANKTSRLNKPINEMTQEELEIYDAQTCANQSEFRSEFPKDAAPMPDIQEEVELYQKQELPENIKAIMDLEDALAEAKKKIQDLGDKTKGLLATNKDQYVGTDTGDYSYDDEDLKNIDFIYSTLSKEELVCHMSSLSKYLNEKQ